MSDAAPVMGLAGLAGGFVDVLVHIEDEHGNRLTRVASGALTEVPLSPARQGPGTGSRSASSTSWAASITCCSSPA